VIAQFTNEGAKYIYGSDTSIIDMKSGVFSYGAPEWMITNLVMAQLGRYYGIPIWSTGGCSDSKILDSQAVSEAALSLLLATQSGANLIHDVGAFLNFGLTGSLELVTICDEFISMYKYLLGGFQINDETLAVDLIKEIGPGGHFLSHKHTRDFFHKEHWMPSLLDRQFRNNWEKSGSKNLIQRASEKTKKILETPSRNPLPEDIEKQLDQTFSKMEKKLTK
jgi:trimethylamine--corrinoid protein Co-methyltransferase